MNELALIEIQRPELPASITEAGQGASWRFLEFFAVNIRNRNTRAAYARAAGAFLRWCEGRGLGELAHVQPMHVAAYIEQLGREMSPPRMSGTWCAAVPLTPTLKRQ